MTATADDDLKRREEAKRAAVVDPVEQWRAFQAFLAWADAQAQVPRNSPQRCKELERAKLARLAEQVRSGSVPQ